MLSYVASCTTMAVLFTSNELRVIVATMALGTGSLIAGMITKRQGLCRFALLDAFAIFLASLIVLGLSNMVFAFLWINMAQLLMLLFTVEIVEAYFGAFGSVKRHVFSRLGKISMILVSGYVLSLGSIALGSFLVSSVPLIADVSLYVVVILVSLPLLLIIREKGRVGS